MLRAFFYVRGIGLQPVSPMHGWLDRLLAGRKEGLPDKPRLLDSPLTMDVAVGMREGDNLVFHLLLCRIERLVGHLEQLRELAGGDARTPRYAHADREVDFISIS